MLLHNVKCPRNLIYKEPITNITSNESFVCVCLDDTLTDINPVKIYRQCFKTPKTLLQTRNVDLPSLIEVVKVLSELEVYQTNKKLPQ